MSQDPRIEAAALEEAADVIWMRANAEHGVCDQDRETDSYAKAEEVAREVISAYLTAADKAATITAEDLVHDENFDPVKQFPMGTIVESKDGSVWYWSEDDEWETLNLPGSKSLRGPARVIHFGGTE